MNIKELGHVVLYVSDLSKSANFYKDILGFREITRTNVIALFGGGRTHHELLLIEVGGQKVKLSTPQPGLYHIGFKIGDSTLDLKKAYQELKERGIKISGTADHKVTHSLYIEDPDGNELELYVDVDDSWKSDPKAVLANIKPLDL